MFNLEARVIACEVKDYDFNGRKGNHYPSVLRIGQQIFHVGSKVDLTDYVDQDCTLTLELREKTPKVGEPYVGVRILAVV